MKGPFLPQNDQEALFSTEYRYIPFLPHNYLLRDGSKSRYDSMLSDDHRTNTPSLKAKNAILAIISKY
jgi:hypothetical protein